MSYKELNNYVLNYIETPNMTGRAIMLDGKWGSGKSFYIRYTLKDELKKHKYECVIISLYGQNDIKELNSVVYSKFKCKNYWHKLPKYLSSVGFLTVTGSCYQVYKDFIYQIYKGFVYSGLLITIVIWLFFSFLLSGLYFKSIEFENTVSIEDVKQIGKLKKTLIVLEDVERTNIDIFDLFGWVNSLCDRDGNDGAKILLVVNEEKLKEKLGERQEKIYDEEKEKTVMDTIQFEQDFKVTIYNILKKKFNSKKNKDKFKELNEIDTIKNICNLEDKKEIIDNSEELKEIEECFESSISLDSESENFESSISLDSESENRVWTLQKFNYREFITACQKTCEILKFFEDKDDEFRKRVFINVLCLLQFSGKEINNKRENIEFSLFENFYSTYSNLCASESAIKERITKLYFEYRQLKNNDNLKIIENWTQCSDDTQVVEAISNLCTVLRNKDKLKETNFLYKNKSVLRMLVIILFRLKYDVGFYCKYMDEIFDLIIESFSNRDNQEVSKAMLCDFSDKLDITITDFNNISFVNDNAIPRTEKELKSFNSKLKDALSRKQTDMTASKYADIIKNISLNRSSNGENNLLQLLEYLPKFILSLDRESLVALRNIIQSNNVQDLDNKCVEIIKDLPAKLNEKIDNYKQPNKQIQKWMIKKIIKIIEKIL